MPDIRLIVGLGNPGDEYEKTRHNVGFLLLDRLQKTLWKGENVKPVKEHNSLLWQSRIAGRDVWLQKPLTYMNRSGEAVQSMCQQYHILPEEMVVIVDDVALPLGRLRLRLKGGDGGHNGLRSIIHEIGVNHFPRLRIGVGSPDTGTLLRDYVLHPFSENEMEVLHSVLDTAVDMLVLACHRGIEWTMNRVNTIDLTRGQSVNSP